MNQQTVLVVDDDPKNIEILVGALINSGFQAATALDGLDAWQKIKKYLPDLVLTELDLPEIDGFQLLTKLKTDPKTASIPLIFLTRRSGIQDKVKSFSLGAKDYIVKPLHVREIIARIRMILARLDRRKREEIEVSSRLVGRLQELSVADLIESFAVERKTGILNLTNENNKSGQIFFKDGSVVNAVLGNFRAEKAVYQMLPWERGSFAMVLQDVDVADEVAVSNLGLLIEGFKRLETRQQLLNELPSPYSIFTLEPNFVKIMEKKKVTPDVAKFVELFDGKRNVLKIIDESYYDDLTTLERMVKLYKRGFLREVSRPTPEEEEIGVEVKEALLTAEEYDLFAEKILKDPKKTDGKILILGTIESGKTEIIRSIAKGSQFQTRRLKRFLSQSLDFGKVSLKNGCTLSLFGLSVEKQMISLLRSLLAGMSGYIILIDATKPETFDYMSYLIKTIKKQFKLPHALVVTRLTGANALSIEEVARRLTLEDHEELIPCQVINRENAKKILLKMKEANQSA